MFDNILTNNIASLHQELSYYIRRKRRKKKLQSGLFGACIGIALHANSVVYTCIWVCMCVYVCRCIFHRTKLTYGRQLLHYGFVHLEDDAGAADLLLLLLRLLRLLRLHRSCRYCHAERTARIKRVWLCKAQHTAPSTKEESARSRQYERDSH